MSTDGGHAAGARAGPRAINMEECTWEEIRAFAREGAVALVPTASLEQHGPHLPVNTDMALVTAVAREAAQAARISILLTPTVWIGLSTHHSAFFAVTLSAETYIRALTEVGCSLAEAGFRRIFFLNGHGGNTDALRIATKNVRDRHRVVVGTGNYWAIAADAILAVRDSSPGTMGHACEFETACMWHLVPPSVRTGRLARNVPLRHTAYFTQDLIHGSKVTLGLQWPDFSSTGVLGDPTLASPEKGQRFFRAAVDAVTAFLREFATWNLGEQLEI